MFTERQRRLLDFCKNAGYGWAKFALSVEKQGRCTRKQEDTLCSMHNRIVDNRRRVSEARRFSGFPRKQSRHGRGWNMHGGDWTDHNLDATREGYASDDRQ